MDWAVVRTHPGAEARASEHLNRQDIGSFFPQYLASEVRRGRRVETARPVFPSYGFVNMADAHVRSVRGTRGIAELLGVESNIVCAHVSSYVKFLRASCDERGYVVLPEPPGRRIGDRVYIESGPLQGSRGVYDGQTSQQRVFVLLRMMGRTVRARVAEVDLAA